MAKGKRVHKQTKWSFISVMCMWKWAESDYLKSARFDPRHGFERPSNAVGNEMITSRPNTTDTDYQALVTC